MEKKTVAHSEYYASKNITPYHCNAVGNVHAGDIMQFIYNTAYTVAKEHAQINIVTAKVDEISFLHPIMVGSVVTCHAYLVFVGRTSMVIATDVSVSGLQPKTLALTACFTMIGVDENRNPVEVPQLELVTAEERERYEKAAAAYREFKAKPKE